MWPAIGKGNVLGFRKLFDEYPDRIEAAPIFRLLLAKLMLSFYRAKESANYFQASLHSGRS